MEHLLKVFNNWHVQFVLRLIVRLGEYDLSSTIDCIEEPQGCQFQEPIDVKVDKIFIHEKFDLQTGINDIALIKLNQNEVSGK